MHTPLPRFRPAAVAFDLDGTVLDYEGALHDTVIAAVRRIEDAGIRVFLVTGRLQLGAERYWLRLGLTTPLSCCNGGYIGFPGEEPFHHMRLADGVRRKVVDLDMTSGMYFNYAIDNKFYTLRDGEERKYYTETFSPVTLASGAEDILSRGCPTKCLCITADEKQPAALALVREALGDGADITTSNSRFIEIMPPGVHKGVAVNILADWLGVTAADFVAVGDAMNDVPMLRAAGHALSFTSGDPRMAEHAEYLLPPLWEGGSEELLRILGVGE